SNALAFDRADDFECIETAMQYDAAAAECQRQTLAPCPNMKQRHCQQHLVAKVGRYLVRPGFSQRQHCRVRQHGALGTTRGAAGIEDTGDMLRSRTLAREALATACKHLLVPARPCRAVRSNADVVFYRWQLRAQRADKRTILRFDEQHPRRG